MGLATAIIDGNIDSVKELVLNGADVNHHIEKGWSPLNLAIRHARFEIAKLLLEAGANPNASDGNDWLPISVTVKNELFDMADIAKSTDFEHGYDTLHVKNCEKTKAALEGIRHIFIKIDLGTPLPGVDCMEDNFSEKFLNPLDFFGIRSLDDAMKKGRLEFLNLLMKHGAKWDTKNVQNCSPLNLAIIKDDYDIVKFLVKHDVYDFNSSDPKLGRTPLNRAVAWGNVDIVKLFMSHGANIHTTDVEGTSPLHFAVKSMEMTKFLIDQGANINQCDQYGYTPFTGAIEVGTIDIVKFLVANGADVNFIDGYSWTPLGKAIHCNNLEIVKYLIQQGADVNLIDNEGETPLTTAIEKYGNLDIVKLLVENGANVNDIRTGWLPMSYAINYKKPDIVRFLMGNGANLNYLDDDGKKAIEVALHENVHDIKMFKMLVM